MNKKKVKMAVIGTSWRANTLLETYHSHPQLEIVACCDIAQGLAEECADAFFKLSGQQIKHFTSYEKMCKAVGFDALLIACDPDIQVEIACDAMNRGIHVMTEVPAAFSIEQCWELVHTVEKTGAKYQLAEQTRYWNFIRIWREMARQKAFGKIIYAEGEYLHYEPTWDSFMNVKTGRRIVSADPAYYADPDYRLSWRGRLWRNPIFYLPHTLSPLLSITGGRITKVSCFGTRPLSYATEGMMSRDIQNALMYNSDDIVFSVRAGFSSPYGAKSGTGAHWYQVKGTERTVEWNRSTIDTPKMWTKEKDWQSFDWGTSDPDAPEHIKNSPHGGSDYYPIDYFIDAILNDKTPPMDVYKAVETAAPAILAAQSCEKGGVMLEVPDFRKQK